MSKLMRALLERQGIYMNEEAGAADGGAGGAAGAGNPGEGAGDAGDGQASGQPGEGEGGTGEGAGDGGDGNPGDDKGSGDGDGKTGDDKGKGKESKPSLSDKEAQLLKDMMKWKDQAKTFEQQVAEVRGVLGDIPLEDVKKLLDNAKEQERLNLEKRGEYDRIVAQMKTENQKLLSAKDTENATLRDQLAAAQKQIEDLTIGQSFRSSEFILEKSTLPPSIAQKEFGQYFEFEEGKLVPYDKPRGAKERTPIVDANGQPKSFNQAIEELYNQHPDAKSLIKASMKPGAGSRNQPDVRGKDTSKTSDLRGVSKIEAGLKSLESASQ